MEEKIAKGAVTETKIAKETIDSLKSYNNTKTNLDALENYTPPKELSELLKEGKDNEEKLKACMIFL